MLPDNFSPSEHLQDTIKKIYNRAVREYFKDLGGDDWLPNVNSSRDSLRMAVQHFDGDTFFMTIAKMLAFDLALNQRMQGVPGFEEGGKGPYRKHKPQILLYFQEDNEDIEPGYAPVTARISFRLMNYTSESITTAIATNYAMDIRSEFATNNGYVWRKGKEMWSYSNWEQGYQLQLLCRSEADAVALVQKVISIQNDTYQPEFMNVNKNQAESIAYPTNPGTDIILGESRKLARRRPIADVRFQYALMKIDKLPNPITLVDRSGTWPNPLVSV